jgi:hypothetical protein
VLAENDAIPTERQRELQSSPLARRATWTLLVAALAVMIGCCWLVDFDRILRRTPDDAYYYFGIAENIAKGNGPTFDGINKTSGFQPLWMLCLTPVFWFCPNALETAVRIGLTIQAVFLFVAGALIVSVLSRLFSWKVVLGVAVCYTFLVFSFAVNGMETAAVVLTLAGLFAYGFHAKVFSVDRPSLFKKFVFGILLGLVMLSRLDTVFLGAAIVAFCAWPALVTTGRRLASLAGAAAILAGASLVVAPYLLYNHVTLGAMSPISGALKSGFPHISVVRSWQAMNIAVGLPKMALLALILLFALLYVVWYVTTGRRGNGDGGGCRQATQKSQDVLPTTSSVPFDARFYFHTSMAALACAILLHALHTLLFMKWAMCTWHFYTYFLFAAVAVAAPLEKLISTRVGGAAYWWAIGGLVAVGILGYSLRMTVSGRLPTWQTVSYEAALWAREHTDPSDVFALKDTGNFGYFSQRRVINLDGVVNNLEYQNVLKNRELQEYFRRNHVKYLVLHATKDEHPHVFDRTYTTEPVEFRSNLYGVWSDPIPLEKGNEVYRATYLFKTNDEFVIWRIFPGTKSP